MTKRPAPAIVPTQPGIPFPDRRDFQCAFIVGDTPFAQRVCGKPTDGGSWCKECGRRVFSGVVAGRAK